MNNRKSETYLNHPTFGLLYRICLVKDDQELFTTLYAQRLFFMVTINVNVDRLAFEIISRSEARLLVESMLRRLLMNRDTEKHQELQEIYQRTFQ